MPTSTDTSILALLNLQPWPSDFKGSTENSHCEPPFHPTAISGHLEKSEMENINPENNYVKPPLRLADIGGYSKTSQENEKP